MKRAVSSILARSAVRFWRSGFLLVILAFLHVMTSSSLTAEVTVVRLMHSAAGKEAETIEGLADIFNLQNPDIRLEVENARKRGQGFYIVDYIKDEVRAGRGPDLFLWVHDKIAVWASEGIIQPIDGFIGGDRSEFFPSTVEAVSYKGKLYGLPLSFECLLLFYNKDIVSDPPLTTDDLLQTAKRVTRKKEGIFGLCYQNTFYHHAPWYNAFSGELFDHNGRPLILTRAMRDSLLLTRRIEQEQGIFLLNSDIGVEEINWDIMVKYFNEGRLAMMVTGPWTLKDISPEIRLGLSRLPFVTEANNWAQPYLGVKAIMMTRVCRDPRAAARVAKFYSSSYAGYILSTRAGYQPANKGSYEFDEINQNRTSAVFRDQAIYSRPLPNRPEMDYVWQIMNDYRSDPDDPATLRKGVLTRVKYNGEDPVKVMKEAQAWIDSRGKYGAAER